MATNRRLVTTNQPDCYVTPVSATLALLKVEKFHGSILEPACGDGAISKVLKKHSHRVVSHDLYDYGYGRTGKDFLFRRARCENLITNPPYNIANDFVLRALDITDGKIALLLRLAFLEGSYRLEAVYRKNPPSRVHVFSKRLSIYRLGSTKRGGGTTAYGWFVWDMRGGLGKTELKWMTDV